MRESWNRLRDWFRRDRLAAELDEELRFHRRLLERDQRAAGLEGTEAAYAARRRLGNTTTITEEIRGMWSFRWIEEGTQDIQYAVRSLRRSPVFTAIAVLTLALGVGANTAVFTVVNGVLLRPLPFHDPGALLLVSNLPRDNRAGTPPGLYDTQYLEFRRNARSFESVTTFHQSLVSLTGVGEPARLAAAMVTAEFFTVLGVQPAIGRAFAADEGAPGRERVVVLGDDLWRTRFGGDRSIVGKPVTLDGNPFTVIGVMPAGFAFPSGGELWLPIEVRLSPNLTQFRAVVGRLRPGVTPTQAQAELEALARTFPATAFGADTRLEARVRPLKHYLVRDVERSLLVFAGAVAFVLLIACANVANLLLMRAASRRSEMALRAALGADRRRLMRQLLTESVVISLAGAAAGVPLAALGVRALLALAPAGLIPRAGEIDVDGWVLAFTLLAALVTGLLFGMAPAVQGTRRELRESMGHGARTARTRYGMRHTLVVAEIALALMLLAGAGLMIRSFQHMRTVDLGFHPENVVTMTVDLPGSVYGNAERMHDFHDRVLARLSALPQTLAAGAVNWRPLGAAQIMGTFRVESRPKPGFMVVKPVVSPDYFRAMGIGLSSGRAFTDRDAAKEPGVAIVSQSVANRLWPGESAIGKRISMADEPKPSDWLTVVGAVDDIRQQTLTSDPDPAIYLPYRQVTATFFLDHMTFMVRSSADPVAVARAMRGILGEIDKDQPVQALGAMQDLVAETTREPLFQARLLAAFSALALVLAAIGIYGVLAYAVEQRTREIGVRMALGAKKVAVVRSVLRHTLGLAAVGMLIGAAGALAVTRVLTKFLFGVTATDPATFAAVVLLLAAVALAAGLIPAWRASRVDPLLALRHE